MKNKIYILLILIPLSLIPFSCTDLDIEPSSELTADNFFADPDNLVYAFGAAYTNMYHFVGNKYGFVAMDCGTDLTAVPQRGGDWFDGGEWHRWHRLSIQPIDNYVSHWWNNSYAGISTINRLIFQFENPEVDIPNREFALAELRAFRALYYYWLLDLFGNVPINTEFDVPADFAPATAPREEVYEFVEQELLDALPFLSEETGLSTYGRVNYYVAQTVLAKLYANAEVYTGTPQWGKAEAALDEIINSGEFSLAASYQDNFQADASTVNEIIMGVPFDEIEAEGFEIHLFSLHYNLQEKYGLDELPWNGICLQESLFDLFEQDDLRLNSIIYGPQTDASGEPITDPSYERFNPMNPSAPRDPDGAPLNLTPEVNQLEPNCLRQAGARFQKYAIPDGTGRYVDADFPIFRYSDVLLLKAEAAMQRGDAGTATAYVNMVRERSDATPLGTATMQDIMDERARELFGEGHRRSDLIRWGTFADPRWEFDGADFECAKLWPVPQSQINTNPNLIQNPCY